MATPRSRRALLIPALALVAMFAAVVLVVLSDGDALDDGRTGDPVTNGGDPLDGPSDTPPERRPAVRVRAAAGAEAGDEQKPQPDPPITDFGLHVVTSGDSRPVRGLVVDVIDEAGRAVRTNSEGFAFITANDDETDLAVSTRAPGAERVELVRGVRDVVVPPPIPVEVRYVDAETGQPLVGGSRGAADGDLLPTWPGQDYDFRTPPFRAPAGHASPTGPQRRRVGRVSPFASRAIITVPVAREARIRVQVVNDHGLVVPRATITVATATGPVRAVATNDDGEARITGIPFHRRELVHAVARFQSAGGAAEPTPMLRPDEEVFIRIVLDDVVQTFAPPRPTHDDGGLADEPSEDDHPTGRGTLTAELRRRDGTRAAGARVRLSGAWAASARTNDDGVARFDRLPPGEYRITGVDAGLNPTSESVTLGDGEARVVTLTESKGRALRVRVFDARGEPLPFARVDIDLERGTRWTRLDGGDQFLDSFTDATGELALTGVPEGDIPLRATYGSRSATVNAGAAETLEITIPDPRADGR